VASITKAYPRGRADDLLAPTVVGAETYPWERKLNFDGYPTGKMTGNSEVAVVTSVYTHPMKKDVKGKKFSPPLWEMRLW